MCSGQLDRGNPAGNTKESRGCRAKPSFPFEDLQIISPTRRTIELEELKAKR